MNIFWFYFLEFSSTFGGTIDSCFKENYLGKPTKKKLMAPFDRVVSGLLYHLHFPLTLIRDGNGVDFLFLSPALFGVDFFIPALSLRVSFYKQIRMSIRILRSNVFVNVCTISITDLSVLISMKSTIGTDMIIIQINIPYLAVNNEPKKKVKQHMQPHI